MKLCDNFFKQESNRLFYLFWVNVYLNWFPPQDEEVLCSHHHESHELMAQYLFDLVSLKHIYAGQTFMFAQIQYNIL